MKNSKFKIREDGRRKAEDSRQKTEIGRRNLEDRNRKFENESRKPKAEITNSPLDILQRAPVIYGVSPVLEALRAGSRRVEKILIADGAHEKRLHEIFELAKRNGIRFEKIPRRNFSKFVDEEVNHQGVVALVAAADYANFDELFDEIINKENAMCVILDGVEDPRNLGAVLRTVEGAGAGGVFIPERRAASLTETVAKSSAGASEYVKVAKVSNVNRLIEQLKENNVWVVGTSLDASLDYTDWDWTRASALVLGGEGKGLHRLTAEKCDALVKIPLHGKIESLNVSVACGVILFEANRQRRKRRMENGK